MRDRPDDSGGDQSVEDQLHRDRGNQETEDLLGDQHAVLIELLTDPVRPAKHHHVQQQDEDQDAERYGEDTE
jgi:hypothetical protein